MADHRPLLDRLLTTPDLAKAVPQLEPQVLQRVIQHCGLEECAEIVALATPAQIERVLDVDLWRAPTAGRDEAFDAHRFGEWLEVLMQAGEDVAVQKLAALDIALIVAGFSQHVSVFDVAAVSAYTTADGDEVAGRAFDRGHTAAIGGFIVEDRSTTTWDTVVDVLSALNVERPDYFRRLMRACVSLSSGEREEDASHTLLNDREQAMFDLATTRELRRDAAGYVTPADARAFLQSARDLRLDGAQPALDPGAHAYFRSLASLDAEPVDARSPTGAAPRGATGALPVDTAAVATVMDMLSDAGVVARPRALLTTGDSGAPRLSYVRDYLERHPSGADELAYLTNLLLAGGSIQGRPFSAQEASDMAASTCNLGLERWPHSWPDVSLVPAFQAGWQMLYRDVCLFAAESLIDTLAGIRHPDREIQSMLNQLRRELIRHGKAGAPWRARDSFDAIMILDAASWAVISGFIAEAPVLHPAAGLRRRTLRTIDPAEFEFIADNGSIQAVRDFLTALAENLL